MLRRRSCEHEVLALVAFFCAVLALDTPAVAGPAVSFSVLAQAGCGPNNVEGWEFQTTADVTVSALGVYDHLNNGTDFAIPVGLYDSSCTLLASVTIPAGTNAALRGGYRYVGITPVALTAGQTFRIAAVMHCNDYTPQFTSLTNVSVDPSLTAVQTRRIGFGSALACPTETSALFGFAPNFLIGPGCGNDVVQTGEQCDDGNNTDGDCCSSTCQYEAQGGPCPGDDEVCTDDVCNATGTCTHPAGNAGAICRPDAGECDVAEQCDGSTPRCPADGFAPDGTGCTDDGLYCTGEETCQGGTCTSSGDPCAVGTCDESTDHCLTPSVTATATPSVTATASSSGSVTPTQTTSPTFAPADTATPTPSTALTVTPSPTATGTPATVACAGDCDGSGGVSVDDMISLVSIARGTAEPATCPYGVTDTTDVDTAFLIRAVESALYACGGG